VNPQVKVCGMAAGPRTERSPSKTETRSNRMTRWASQLARVIVCALLLLALASPAAAQRRRRTAQRKESRPAPAATAAAKKSGAQEKTASKGKKEQRFDFTGFELAGSVRMPQLLYFLDRAEEELERASLERRTFVPEMLKSIDEENL